MGRVERAGESREGDAAVGEFRGDYCGGCVDGSFNNMHIYIRTIGVRWDMIADICVCRD